MPRFIRYFYIPVRQFYFIGLNFNFLMCFSMEASWGAGAVLSAIGFVCLKTVRKPEQVLFACVPLVFAVQQFAEGFVWLSLTNVDFTYWQQPMTISFLVLAHIIWPILIPVAVLLLEKDPARRKILLLLSFTGAVLGVYFGWYLMFHHVVANATGHHLFYDRNFPSQIRLFTNAGYAMTAILPLFISGVKKMWTLGLAFFLSFLIAKIFYTPHVISVWCFFAAILSTIVFFILRTGAVSLKNKHLMRQ